MNRTLDVSIDQTTWPQNTAPQALVGLQGQQNINIASFLLMIGYCTVPAHAARHSINSLWAWVRYFGALSGDADFRLNTDFASLDPHQKTILSDDFGMGMSLHLLAGSLNLRGFCDGKYFVDRLSTRTTNTTKGKKRGPRKSPDFVAVDVKGQFHVIECKGTQSGSQYGAHQVQTGVPQKNAIQFATSIKGQSLVTGFQIGTARNHQSNFTIIDPEPDGVKLTIKEDSVPDARETLARGKLAKCLLLAGAPNLGRLMAAPFNDNPTATEQSVKKHDIDLVEALRGAAREEAVFIQNQKERVSREISLDLPFSVEVNGELFRRISIRTEINLSGLATWIATAVDGASSIDWLSEHTQELASGRLFTESHGKSAEIFDGDLFWSRLDPVA
ncbi:hypothetical protein [Roseibium sp.]|uniref:hypothetical protein n=1 Tax=Roseibium sp. TaxID=1936156 RepID=UPI0039EF8F3D